ncbi:MAG: helix-hairpin-helix domain-containing protein [Ignavibacteriales bacterium]|nr:helix-hairpin-helix domain-containing protein [Ignavibacteriales bacterium]
MKAVKPTVIKELQVIPGVGKSIAVDLWELGIRSVSDLKGKDPELLYVKRCKQQGVQIDRCLLYVFRCAVYFAEHKRHDPEKLKWWNWKEPEG